MPCGTGLRGNEASMDLKRLEYFCAIVEKGQISKAAEALHISQPPLSMRLKELEEELDVQLIYREGKAWQVTPEGEALYQRAQFILSYVAGLEKDIRESRNKVSGLVRIGVCPPCLSLASTPIPALNREFPDLRFRVWVMDNQSLERHMQERNLDFALVQLPVQNANYAMLPLARQEFVAVYGQRVPPPEARSIGVEELREAPLMLSRRRDGGGGYDLIMRAFQDKGVRPNVVLDSQDTRLLHKLLRQGMSAVAILPEREVAAGTLESFPMRRLDVPGLDLAPVLIGWNMPIFPGPPAGSSSVCTRSTPIPANNRILKYEKGLSVTKNGGLRSFSWQIASLHFFVFQRSGERIVTRAVFRAFTREKSGFLRVIRRKPLLQTNRGIPY